MYSFYQRPLIMHRLSDHFLSGIKLAAICLFLAACSSDDDVSWRQIDNLMKQ
jgi:hypothetical protein